MKNYKECDDNFKKLSEMTEEELNEYEADLWEAYKEFEETSDMVCTDLGIATEEELEYSRNHTYTL